MNKEDLPYIALTIECLPNPTEKAIGTQVDFFIKRYNLSEKEKLVLAKNLILYSSAIIRKIPKEQKKDFLH